MPCTCTIQRILDKDSSSMEDICNNNNKKKTHTHTPGKFNRGMNALDTTMVSHDCSLLGIFFVR